MKLSGNEVDYTARSVLVLFKNSCSKNYQQKGFNSVPFSYKTPAITKQMIKERPKIGFRVSGFLL